MKKMKKLILMTLISGLFFSLFGKTVFANATVIWIPIAQGEELPPVNESSDRNEVFYEKGTLSLLIKNADWATHQFERKAAILKLEKELPENKLLLEQLTGSEHTMLAEKITQSENEISSYYRFESAFQKVISTEIPLSISNVHIDTDGSKFFFMQVHFNEDEFSDVMQAVSLILEDANVISAEPKKIPNFPETPEVPETMETIETDGSRRFVERHYRIVLGRNPDEGGLAFWVDNLKNIDNSDFSPVYVTLSFFYSQEYLAKKRTNMEFVTDLYAAIMDRESDEEGRRFWVQSLDEGGRREDVISFFIDSKEFSNLLADFGFGL